MSSPYDGFIRYATASFDGDEPVDVSRARDYLYANALHIADQAGQTRVNWVSKSSGAGIAYDSNMEQNSWIKVWTSGEFPLSVQPSGQSYALRVALNGKSSGATNVYWRVIVHSLTDDGDVTTDGPNMIEYKTNSTSPAWLTPNAGSGSANHYIRMSARQVGRALETRSTLSAVSSAVTQTYSACMARVTLYGFHSSSAVGTCNGLYACEVFV